MDLQKVKDRLQRFYNEAIESNRKVREFDVPWSVPYEFSAFFHDCQWEEYGQVEKHHAEEE